MTFQRRPISFFTAPSGVDVDPDDHLELLEAIEAEIVPCIAAVVDGAAYSNGFAERIERIRVHGDQVQGDGPAFHAVRVAAEPADLYKFRSQDHYLPASAGGGEDLANGGWWAIEGGAVQAHAGTFAKALAMRLPWYVGSVETDCHHSIAYGGRGIYDIFDAEPARVPLAKGQSANGRWLALRLERGESYMSQYGLEGRGRLNNDSDAWQQAIDDVTEFYPGGGTKPAVNVVCDRPRPYLTRPHFNGYGNSTFVACNVIGNLSARRGDGGNAGVAVEFAPGCEFCLTMNGVRGSSYQHIDVTGDLKAAIQNIMSVTHPIDTSRGPVDLEIFRALGRMERYNPYFLFGLDCYLGSASRIGSGEEYPRPVTEVEAAAQRAASIDPVSAPFGFSNAVEPDYLPQPIVYYAGTDENPADGGFVSSEPRWIGLRGRGAHVAIIVAPGGAEANADFPVITECSFELVTALYVVCGGQTRNASIRTFTFNRIHTTLSNRMFGAQNGRFGGTATDVSGGTFCARFFDFSSSAVLGSPVFITPYCELLDRIGDFGGGGASDGQFGHVLGGTFTFRHSEERGVPASITSGSTDADMVFEGTRFSFPHGLSWNTPGIELRRCTSSNVVRQAAGAAEPIEAFYNNGCASMSFPIRSTGREVQDIRFAQFELPVDGAGASAIQAAAKPGVANAFTGRSRCIPVHAGLVQRPAVNRVGALEQNRPLLLEKTGAGITSIVRNGRRVDITLNSLTDGDAFRRGCEPGDQLRENNTGTMMMIVDRAGAVITARLETNFISDGVGGFDELEDFTTNPVLHFTSSRAYLTSSKIWARRRPGDAVLYDCRSEQSNVTTGAAPELNEIEVGDYIIEQNDGFTPMISVDGRINAIDPVAGTITTTTLRDGYAGPDTSTAALDGYEQATVDMIDQLKAVPEIAAVPAAVAALEAFAPASRLAMIDVLANVGDRVPIPLLMRAPPAGNLALVA